MKLYVNNIAEPNEINKNEFADFLNQLLNVFDDLNSVSMQVETKDKALIRECMNGQTNINENDLNFKKLKEKLSKINMKANI